MSSSSLKYSSNPSSPVTSSPYHHQQQRQSSSKSSLSPPRDDDAANIFPITNTLSSCSSLSPSSSSFAHEKKKSAPPPHYILPHIAIVILGGSGFVGRELSEKWPTNFFSQIIRKSILQSPTVKDFLHRDYQHLNNTNINGNNSPSSTTKSHFDDGEDDDSSCSSSCFEFIETLLKEIEGSSNNIYAINRGNTYWGKKLNAPMVKQIYGNRRSQSSMNAAFDRIVQDISSSSSFTSEKNIEFIIIDFSSDDEDDITRIQHSLFHLSNTSTSHQQQQSHTSVSYSLLHYILISTDSVYADPKNDQEEEQIRSDPTWRVSELNYRIRDYKPIIVTSSNSKNRNDFRYSTRKRRIEKCIFSLENYFASNAFDNAQRSRLVPLLIQSKKITSLRMADVIGAFDDTNRFWATMLWAEYALKTEQLRFNNNDNNNNNNNNNNNDNDKTLDDIFDEYMKIDPSETSRLVSFTVSWDMINVIWKLVVRIVATRACCSVFDKKQHHFHEAQKQRFGGGESISSASSTALAAATPLDILRQNISGCFNVACVEPMTNRDFVRLIFCFVAGRFSNNSSSPKKNIGSPLREDEEAKTSDDSDSDSNSSCSDSSSSASSSSSSSSSDDVSSSSDDDDDATCDYYPSVSCGPLNVQKAIDKIEWQPMKLVDAILKSCEFFADPKLRRLKEEFSRGAVKKLPRKMRSVFM